MQDISLKALLEAGCHFGHKVEKWHPKANKFIYQARDGVHIIDLAKTKEGLKNAAEFLMELSRNNRTILFVATKRQAKNVVTDAAKRAGTFYLTNRWVGGFMTNWEEVKKNIDKMNRYRKERTDGSWQKFPKHEVVQLEKELRKLEAVYSGVADLIGMPSAIFIVDIKREIAAIREAGRKGIPIVAIVDTNADPNTVDYPIPANDDAVGSVQFIVNYLADAVSEGNKIWEKTAAKMAAQAAKGPEATPGIVKIDSGPVLKKAVPMVKPVAKAEVKKPEVKPEVKKDPAKKKKAAKKE